MFDMWYLKMYYVIVLRVLINTITTYRIYCVLFFILTKDNNTIVLAKRRCSVCHYYVNDPDYLIHDGVRVRHSCPGTCVDYEKCKYDRGHAVEAKQKKKNKNN